MPVVRIALLCFLAYIPTTKIFATAQMPDKLIYEGKEYSLHSNPLEEYFSKNESMNPRNKTGYWTSSTALHRRYVANFEMKEGRLFVDKINIMVDMERNTGEIKWKDIIDEIFKNPKDRRLDWFTGLLVLPCGNVIHSVNMAYKSTHENYILLEMNNGKCVAEKKISGGEYASFKKKQFELYKQTDEYKKLLEERKRQSELFKQTEAYKRLQAEKIKMGFRPDEEDVEKSIEYWSVMSYLKKIPAD